VTTQPPRPDAATVAAALATERREVLALLADLTRGHGDIVAAAQDSNLDDEHDPEGATIAYERSQLATLLDQARAHRQEVEAALGRLDAGTYGICVVCGEAIGDARLEARPSARTCLRHAVT
jgi:DnaK suppressor protein